jgi:hypothetical protein
MMLYNESEEVEEGALAGAALGALAGIFIPFPFGMIGTAAFGAALGHWVKKNKEKLRRYCSSKYKEGSSEHSHCMSYGRELLARRAEEGKAKAKAKKK